MSGATEMLLDDMVDYYSSGGIGTAATDLFAGFMPETPDACGAVYETGGRGPDRAMGNTAGVISMEWPRIQVVFRDTVYNYADARSKAHSAWKLTEGLPKRTINGVQYHWGATVQSPFQMGRDQQGRVLIAFNADIAKDLTP